jgi:MOSC domain-containing protein YiiM
MTSGSIHQINVSNGGVPKRPVPSARVEVGGVVGDHQADRRHHGGPDQDLCLYSLEVIEALRAEGHPIEPGFAGENITIAGVDWSVMRPGRVLRLGDDLVALITDDAIPCSKNAGWFRERDFRRMSQEQHPGWSRWYARVLTPGDISVGDTVVVEAQRPGPHAAEAR